MANVSKTAFNLVDFARQNKLKLVAKAELKDGLCARFFTNDKRVDCFVMDRNKQIVAAKGASGSHPNLFETVKGIIEKLGGDIVSVSTNVK